MAATTNQTNPANAGASTELELAAALYSLLACGHERLGYSVSGTYALWQRSRDRRRWTPAVGTERVPIGEWRPCVEVLDDGETRPRRLNPWVLASHVRGRGWVAASAPSWCSWLAFDIDAHVARELRDDQGDEPIPLDAFRRALDSRDQVLAELWRALELGPGREPVIVRSPGLGYHVYLPLARGGASTSPEHTWPAGQIATRAAEALHARGVVIAPGRLELFPAARVLRAPCGLGTELLVAARPDQPDDLGLAPVAGTTMERRAAQADEVQRVRRPWAMVAALVAQWEAARRPLDEWLHASAAAWSPVWGPFAHPDRAAAGAVAEKNGVLVDGELPGSQHIDEVQGGPAGRQGAHERVGLRALTPGVTRGVRSESSDPFIPITPPVARSRAWSGTANARAGGPPSGPSPLRRGVEFRRHLGNLLRSGVVVQGSRHDAVLSLVFWWHVSGKGEDQVRRELEAWARVHAHVSRLKGERFVRACLREGMHYYHRIKKLPQRARSLAATVARTRPLRPADLLTLVKVREDVREEAWAILEYLYAHAEGDGRVTRPVTLGRAELEALVVGDRRVPIDGRGRHRAEVVAVRELERLGVLSIYVDYSTGHHGRIWTCWYQFGTGMLPQAREPGTYGAWSRGSEGALVLGERRVSAGTLRVLSDGPESPASTRGRLVRCSTWVELEPASGVVVEKGGGAGWWRSMFERRRFTPGEFWSADEGVVIGGPWTRSAVPRRYGAMVEDELAAYPSRRVGRTGSYDPAQPIAPATPPVTAVATGATAADPRAELAAGLGVEASTLTDCPSDVAAAIATSLRAFDRRT